MPIRSRLRTDMPRQPDRYLASHVRRGVAVTTLTMVLLLLGAAPASAHTRLLSSDPTDGASLDTGPQRVSLVFNDPMNPGFSTVTVVGPDGVQYQTGEPTVTDGTVTIGMQPLGPAGRYEIGYRVVSADGHPVAGSLAFTLTTPVLPTSSAALNQAPPATAAPAPSPPASGTADSEGTPIWPWMVGAVLLIGAGVIVALRFAKAATRADRGARDRRPPTRSQRGRR